MIISDRGRNYTSSAFTAFCRELDINHTLTSAYHHQSNPAERAIRTVKSIMRKCMETGNSWRLGLLEYLCTPISDHIPSPSELLNRRYRGVQPFLQFHANASTASFLPQERIQDEQQKRQNLMSSTIIRAVLLNARKSMKVLMYWSILQIRSQNGGRRVL